MRDVSRPAYGGALVLAGIAGYIDAIAFILTGGLFVSFMSGNSTQAGVEIVEGRITTALIALAMVASFVIGVVLGRALDLARPTLSMSRRLYVFAVGLAVATIIIVMTPESHAAVIPVACVMGAMNTLFVGDGRARVPLTYATGTLVTCGIALAERLSGDRSSDWVRPLLLWGAITLGAFTGALGWFANGLWALIAAPVTLTLLAFGQSLRERRARRPGNSFANRQ